MAFGAGYKKDDTTEHEIKPPRDVGPTRNQSPGVLGSSDRYFPDKMVGESENIELRCQSSVSSSNPCVPTLP